MLKTPKTISLVNFGLAQVDITLITKSFSATNFRSKFLPKVYSPKFCMLPKVYHAETFRKLVFFLICCICVILLRFIYELDK